MAGSKPRGLQWRSNTFFIVCTVAIAMFTDLFLYGLVVPILPFLLKQRLHIPTDQTQSQVSILLAVYAVASVIFSPIAGVIADKVPARQLPFLVGLVAMLTSTIIFALGHSMAVLIIGRIFQGISAATVWTVGLALVLDTVGPDNLGKTIGSIFGFISIGELAAPVLGGILYAKAGYGGVFSLGFAFLVIDFVLRLLLIEKKTAAKYEEGGSTDDREARSNQEDSHEDESGDHGSEHEPLLAKHEDNTYKIREPPRWIRTFPIFLCLKDPRLLTAQLVSFMQANLLGILDATIPVQAEKLYGFNSLKAGLLFIAIVLPYLILGPVAGWAVDRYGPKPASTIGFSYLSLVLTLLRLVRPGGTAQIIQYCAQLASCGVGLAIIGSPGIVEAAAVIERYYSANPDLFGKNGPYAQLYGLNSMVFSLGLAVGPLFGGALSDHIGYGNMNLVIAVFCLLTALLTFVFMGGRPQLLRRDGDTRERARERDRDRESERERDRDRD